jgi:hypothetical protein
MSRPASIVGRLLEDDELPQPPGQPAAEQGGQSVRDLFLRLSKPGMEEQGTLFGLEPYTRAAEQLGRRDSRKIANHTYLHRKEDNSIAYRFHDTDLLTFYPDGHVVADTGGWPTMSTRARLNERLPGGWQVYSESFKKHGEEEPYLTWGGYPIRAGIGKLFWYNRQTNCGTWASSWRIPFTDGDVIQSDGTLQAKAEPKPRGRRKGEYGWP